MIDLASAFRALRHREYRLIFSGQFVSMVGTWMQAVAQGWLVYRLTGSAALLGLVSFAGLAPTFLLSGLGGALADRVDPRRVVIATQSILLVQATALGLLTLTHRVTIPHVLVLAMVMGLVNAFDMPASQVLVSRAVPREDLPNAIALNSSLFHGSRILGPSLAGLVVAGFGEGWCFLLNGASYLAALTGLLLLRLAAPPRSGGTRPIGHELLEGLRFVNGSPTMRRLFLLQGLATFLAMPYTVLMPAVAKDMLHGGPRLLGWLMGAGGIGATFGALRLASQRDPAGLSHTMQKALALLGLALTAFALSRLPWLSILLIVPLGFCMVSVNTSNNTLVQLHVPGELRGRVMALHAMVFMGAMPLGCLLAGHLAQSFGTSTVLLLEGAGCLLTALAYLGMGRRQDPFNDPAPRR
jgi:MFS family permease